MKMKKSSPSSSHASIITRVFPASWFSRFKQKGSSNPETHHSVSKKQRGKLDFPSSYSVLSPASWKQGKFYGVEDDDDDDAYWRFSFRGDGTEGNGSTGGNRRGISSLSYDSKDEYCVPWGEMQVPRREAYISCNETVSGIMRKKEKQQYQFKDHDEFKRQKPKGETQFSAQRKMGENGRHPRKLSRKPVKRRAAEFARHIDCGEQTSLRLEERDTFETESENMQMKTELRDSAVSDLRSQKNISFSNSSLCSAEEGLAFAELNSGESNSTPERASILDRKSFEDKKFKAAGAKRNSASRGRKLKKNGEKSYSPQREFRIRVLDDMKKGRIKSKKERKAQVAHCRTIYDSFAVIKTSTNPWQDFKDSMVEMIKQKSIEQPQELEELLASYLTLNCDEHHDLIIKVFLEVCFELNNDIH